MSRKYRGRHALGQTLGIFLAISSIFALGAAAAQAAGPYWYTGTTTENMTKLTTEKTVLASVGGATTFEVGKNQGKTVTGFAFSEPGINQGLWYAGVFATGVEFKSNSSTRGVITNSLASHGVATGKLVFTGATTNQKPCEVGGGKIESNEVRERTEEYRGKTYVIIEPMSGPTKLLFTVEIVGCEVEDASYAIHGELVGEAGPLFESSTSHTIEFSKAIQEEFGASPMIGGWNYFGEGQIKEQLAEPLYWALK